MLLLIPAFIAAFAQDEDTLPDNLLWQSLATLFSILRFPTHTLLWGVVCAGGATFFFGGLLVNCLFYGLLCERLIATMWHKRV